MSLLAGIRRRSGPLAAAAAGLALCAFVNPEFQPSDVVEQNEYIYYCAPAEVDAETQTARLEVIEVLKGQKKPKQVTLELSEFPAVGQYLEILRAKTPVLLFCGTDQAQEQPAALVHVQGEWLRARPGSGEEAWQVKQVDAGLQGTFQGDTRKLRRLVKDLTGRGEAHFPVGNEAKFREEARSLGTLKDGAVGSVLFDLEGDGDLDVLAYGPHGSLMLRNKGKGAFEEITDTVGLGRGATAIALGDADGDGAADLLFSSPLAPPRLFLWSGKAFAGTRLGAASGLEEAVGEAIFADLDTDGLPDVLLRTTEGKLLWARNTDRKEGRFVAGALAPPGPFPGGPGVYAADLEGKPPVDLVLPGRDGKLYLWLRSKENEAGSQQAFATGLADCRVSFFDYDLDGDLDLLLPCADARGLLLENEGDGRFADIFLLSGEIDKMRPRWSACAWGDLDQDGRLDLMVLYPDDGPVVYSNRGYGIFVEVTPELGLPSLQGSVAAAAGDLDGDGDVDLVYLERSGELRLLENTYTAEIEPPNPCLKLGLAGKRGLTGARLEIRAESGELLGSHELSGLDARSGACPPRLVSFGFRREQAATLTVRLSDGRRLTRKTDVPEKGAALTLDVDGAEK